MAPICWLVLSTAAIEKVAEASWEREASRASTIAMDTTPVDLAEVVMIILVLILLCRTREQLIK